MNTRAGSARQRVPSIADEAGRWDARLRAPDCSDADRASFAAWRDADSSHREAFERLQSIFATLRHDCGRAEVRALRDEALRATVTYRRRRLVWAAAAACMLACGAGFSFLDDLSAWLTGAEIYVTGTGERSTYILEDGSTMALNAQSRVQVRYSEFQRSLSLLKGQALFNVAKNRRRPFVVHAGDRNIVAVGTQFDVRLDANSVQVTLIEGKVRIEQESAQESSEIVLTPGKQLLAPLSAPLPFANGERLISIDVAKVTGWRDGRIFMDNLSLAEAVAEMNKHSTVQIAVDDPMLAQRRVSGMFKAGEQERFVTALEDYFPIEVRHTGAQQIVLTARR